MNRRVMCIVEGHGEVDAVGVLFRRIWQTDPDRLLFPEMLLPLRVPATKLLKTGELERSIELVARRVGDDGAGMVLLDCDDGCPAEMGPDLAARIAAARPGFQCPVVLAKREYEAWFLAAAESLRDQRGLAPDLEAPPNPEDIRDAKGWLTTHMTGTRAYSETMDQAALTGVFDLTAAQTVDSFDKYWREVRALLEASADAPD